MLLPLPLFAAAANPYDLMIRNGHVIDGTGSAWYAVNIAIRGGKIASPAKVAPSRRLTKPS